MDALLEQRIQYYERLLSTKNRSPIVVQLAALYLDAGRPHDALRYCDNAIAHFPYYTSAHLVRAKVLAALEMRAEARRELELVHAILPDVESVKRMLDEIPVSETETFEDSAATDETLSTTTETALEEVEASQESLESVEEQPPEEEEVAAPPEVPEEPSTEEQELREPVEEGQEAAETEERDPFGLPIESKQTAGEEEAATEGDKTAGVPVEQEEPGVIETEGEPGVADGASFPSSAPAEESPAGEEFEAFSERMRVELSGTENSLTVESYLAPAPQAPPPSEPADEIQDLAEKLQNPEKITPVIDITEKKAPPPSEEDMPASTGFVTPTLAEIYAKQGWYDDAIVAYRTLARIKPAERDRFEKRIQELEVLKKSQEGES